MREGREGPAPAFREWDRQGQCLPQPAPLPPDQGRRTAEGRGQWPHASHRELRGPCQRELGYAHGRHQGVPGPEHGRRDRRAPHVELTCTCKVLPRCLKKYRTARDQQLKPKIAGWWGGRRSQHLMDRRSILPRAFATYTGPLSRDLRTPGYSSHPCHVTRQASVMQSPRRGGPPGPWPRGRPPTVSGSTPQDACHRVWPSNATPITLAS